MEQEMQLSVKQVLLMFSPLSSQLVVSECFREHRHLAVCDQAWMNERYTSAGRSIQGHSNK